MKHSNSGWSKRGDGVGGGYNNHLSEIQSRLLDLGSHIATPMNSKRSTSMKLGRTSFPVDELVIQLEEWIDMMDEILPPLKNFILPGGGIASSTLHLDQHLPTQQKEHVLKFNNQVSMFATQGDTDYGDLDVDICDAVTRMIVKCQWIQVY